MNRAALRELAEALPPGAAVPVPREWLLELLAGSAPAADPEEALDLRTAADVSGYSADHLTRLVREGRLRNLGRKHSPRFRRGDLPRKPGQGGAAGADAETPPSLPPGITSAIAGHITGRRP